MSKVNELFVGWYDYSKEDFEAILSDGLISFDTNVLLNLYRYSRETALETLSLFDSIKNRLVFSYYVAEEYTRNRRKVEADSILEFDKYKSEIEKKYSELTEEINGIPEKRLTDRKKLIDLINKNKDKILTSIEDDKVKKQKMFKEGFEEKICDLINSNILPKFKDDEFQKIKEEGLRRIREHIPPGYKDNEKSENGDYYIFKSLIDYCKEQKKDLIFVTDDTKEDMFINIHGIKKPRSELLNEFYNETKHKLIILSVQEFLKNKKIFKHTVSKDILSEITNISLENIKISYKANSRIKKYLYNIIKYNSLDDIINNYSEIQKSYRTIIRICEGFNDEISIKKFSDLSHILSNGDYELYMSKLLFVSETLLNEKRNEFERITSYYKKYKNEKINSVGIELSNFIILYLNEYMNEDFKAKSIIVRLRELLTGINKGYISEDVLFKEIEYAYDYIMTGEDNYVSI